MFSTCGPHKELHARERARVTMVTRLCARVKHFVLFYNTKVAMLAWKLK